jgi:acyl carrier protein
VRLEEQIRHYIIEHLLFDDESAHFRDDDSLLALGLIDSLGVMELVNYVSSVFAVEVDPLDVTPANFDSLRNIANYIRTKSSAGHAAAASEANSAGDSPR